MSVFFQIAVGASFLLPFLLAIVTGFSTIWRAIREEMKNRNPTANPVNVGLFLFGFGALLLAGMIATVWALRSRAIA